MKQFKLLILLLVIGFVAEAQINYLPMRSRYTWIAGKFDSTVTIPYGLTPSIRTGGFTGPASLFYKTSDSTVYVYTGTQWISVKGAGGSSDSTVFATLYRVDTAKTNIRTTLDTKIDSMRRVGLNVQVYKNGTWITQFTDSVGTGGGGDTSTFIIDTLYNRIATTINADSIRLKSLRLRLNGTTITPTTTDSTLSYNVLAVDSTQLIVIDTAGATTNQIAYIDRTGGDTIKFRTESTSGGSGAFSILQFRIGDELSPSVGDTSLINSGFSGKYLKVFRNGLLQEHVFNDTGFYRLTDSAIRVTPAFTAVDQYLIEARDSASLTQLALETPPAASLLLDTYTGATGAYSLRLLRTAYSGNAIKVRRSSDNTTQDIAFLPSGYLDTASMKTFVSTGTGYIDTWYDQSTNGYNLTQATTGNQPIIIESGGTVYRQEGKVSVKFTSASSHYLTNTSLAAASAADAYIAYVLKNNNVSSNNIGFGMGSNAFVYQAGAAVNKMYAYAGNVYGDYTNSSTVMQLSETIYDGGGATSADRLKYYSDGSAITANSFSGTIPATVSGTGLAIGKLYSVGVYFDGAASEFVIWLSDKSADRTGIESNINTFYSLW